jgi:hypothetical protein
LFRNPQAETAAEEIVALPIDQLPFRQSRLSLKLGALAINPAEFTYDR